MCNGVGVGLDRRLEIFGEEGQLLHVVPFRAVVIIEEWAPSPLAP